MNNSLSEGGAVSVRPYAAMEPSMVGLAWGALRCVRRAVANEPQVVILVMLSLLLPTAARAAEKPRVWVTTDIMEGEPGDEDDDVTMAAFLLLADHYQIEGMAVGASTKLVETTKDWCEATFLADYKREVGRLNAYYGSRYQTDVTMHLSSTGGEHFTSIRAQTTDADFLNEYPSIQELIDAADAGPIYVLNWGVLTEIAMTIKYCIEHERTGTLRNMKIISHWTQKGGPWNCAEDNDACNYVHEQAESDSRVVMYELGPSGQKGMVENICKSKTTLSKKTMFASKLGKHLGAKWNAAQHRRNGMPDFSDGATFLVLMGLGGGLDSYTNDGTVKGQARANALLCNDRAKLFKMLEERALIAAGETK